MKLFNSSQNLSLLLATLLYWGLISCSGSAVKPEDSDAVAGSGTPVADEASLNASGDSDSGRAAGLESIHFAFDSSELDQGSVAILNANALLLQAKTSLQIQLEGHCDQRGLPQYNIALGERRALSVEKELLALGIAKERISVISYGKEHPLDPSDTQEAYAKNRRVNFVVTSR